MCKVEYKKSALKALYKMPAGIRRRMRDALVAIAAAPSAYDGDWKPLKCSSCWRLRLGGYRAICDWQNDRLVLLVLKIGSRGDVYK